MWGNLSLRFLDFWRAPPEFMDNLFFDLKQLRHLGTGTIVGKCVRIRRPELVSIGDYTIIDDFTYISGALEIGAHSHIGPNVTITGGIKKLTVGNYAGIGAGCSIFVGSTDFVTPSFDFPSIPEEFQFGGIREEVVIGHYVQLGSRSVVLPGAQLPEGFASAAMTVVRKRAYEPWTLYGGERCTKLARRDQTNLLAAVRRFEASRKAENTP